MPPQQRVHASPSMCVHQPLPPPSACCCAHACAAVCTGTGRHGVHVSAHVCWCRPPYRLSNTCKLRCPCVCSVAASPCLPPLPAAARMRVRRCAQVLASRVCACVCWCRQHLHLMGMSSVGVHVCAVLLPALPPPLPAAHARVQRCAQVLACWCQSWCACASWRYRRHVCITLSLSDACCITPRRLGAQRACQLSTGADGQMAVPAGSCNTHIHARRTLFHAVAP